jgi:hypothetical protein
MPYSKRWYLVHLLGGKCVDCGEENFAELDIDHIFDDGDLDRKYYSNLVQRYLKNPKRAKERLQVRCKSCHKTRHYGTPLSESIPNKFEVGVFPGRNGKIIGHGTMLGDDPQIIICEMKDTTPIRVIDVVDVQNYDVPMSALDRKREEKLKKLRLFMDVLEMLESPNKIPVGESILVQNLMNTNEFTEEEARSRIRLMLREASIYESRPGHYNRV